jgi:peptidoglycan biosynthesis protein MviN/MurJ (putative lipid II flippase)
MAPLWIQSFGLKGLVLSSLVAAVVQFVLVVAMMSRFTVAMGWSVMAKELFKIVLAGGLMAAVAVSLAGWITEASSSLVKTLLLALVIGVCVLVYGFSSLKLKIEQGSFLLDQLKRKRNRK